MKTLKELSDEYAKKQPKQVDAITEDAPIMKIIPFEAASHPLWNMAEVTTDVTGAGWVEMNAPLPVVDAATNLQKVDLAILGGEMEVPEDTAKMFGGKEKYFAKKQPKVLRKSGATAEQRIYYDNWRKYALDNGKAITAGGTGAGYSLMAVRFVSGEHCGLYSPEGFSNGAMMDVQAINGGNIYKALSGIYQGVLVYGVRLKSYLGLQILNPNTVACICNIDATHIPTAMMVDDLLAAVRADSSGKTKLVMHPKVRSWLGTHKGASLNTTVDTKNMDRSLTHWDGTELVTSYNILQGTESNVGSLPTAF